MAADRLAVGDWSPWDKAQSKTGPRTLPALRGVSTGAVASQAAAGTARSSERTQCYLIALGSNRYHHRFGRPEAVLRAALAELNGGRLELMSASPLVASSPLGPSLRRYANAAALVMSDLGPEDLLDLLKAMERRFGRRRGGRRWGARTLDLDIVLWSGGTWSSPRLTVPHAAFRARRFVLDPAAAIVPCWRDSQSHLSIRQLRGRLIRRRPV